MAKRKHSFSPGSPAAETSYKKSRIEGPSVLYQTEDGSHQWTKHLDLSKSLGEIASRVQRKFGLSGDARLSHVRDGGRIVDIWDDFDFSAFKARAMANPLVPLVVRVSSRGAPSPTPSQASVVSIDEPQQQQPVASTSRLPPPTEAAATPKTQRNANKRTSAAEAEVSPAETPTLAGLTGSSKKNLKKKMRKLRKLSASTSGNSPSTPPAGIPRKVQPSTISSATPSTTPTPMQVSLVKASPKPPQPPSSTPTSNFGHTAPPVLSKILDGVFTNSKIAILNVAIATQTPPTTTKSAVPHTPAPSSASLLTSTSSTTSKKSRKKERRKAGSSLSPLSLTDGSPSMLPSESEQGPKGKKRETDAPESSSDVGKKAKKASEPPKSLGKSILEKYKPVKPSPLSVAVDTEMSSEDTGREEGVAVAPTEDKQAKTRKPKVGSDETNEAESEVVTIGGVPVEAPADDFASMTPVAAKPKSKTSKIVKPAETVDKAGGSLIPGSGDQAPEDEVATKQGGANGAGPSNSFSETPDTPAAVKAKTRKTKGKGKEPIVEPTAFAPVEDPIPAGPAVEVEKETISADLEADVPASAEGTAKTGNRKPRASVASSEALPLIEVDTVDKTAVNQGQSTELTIASPKTKEAEATSSRTPSAEPVALTGPEKATSSASVTSAPPKRILLSTPYNLYLKPAESPLAKDANYSSSSFSPPARLKMQQGIAARVAAEIMASGEEQVRGEKKKKTYSRKSTLAKEKEREKQEEAEGGDQGDEEKEETPAPVVKRRSRASKAVDPEIVDASVEGAGNEPAAAGEAQAPRKSKAGAVAKAKGVEAASATSEGPISTAEVLEPSSARPATTTSQDDSRPGIIAPSKSASKELSTRITKPLPVRPPTSSTVRPSPGALIAKLTRKGTCAICGEEPHHLQKDCPKVKAGVEVLKELLEVKKSEKPDSMREASIEAMENWIERLTKLASKVSGKAVPVPMTPPPRPRTPSPGVAQPAARESSPVVVPPIADVRTLPSIYLKALAKPRRPGSLSGLSASDALIETGDSDSEGSGIEEEGGKTTRFTKRGSSSSDSRRSSSPSSSISDSESRSGSDAASDSENESISGDNDGPMDSQALLQHFLTKPLSQQQKRQARKSAAAMPSGFVEESLEEVQETDEDNDNEEGERRLREARRQRSESSIGDFGGEEGTNKSSVESDVEMTQEPPVVDSILEVKMADEREEGVGDAEQTLAVSKEKDSCEDGQDGEESGVPKAKLPEDVVMSAAEDDEKHDAESEDDEDAQEGSEETVGQIEREHTPEVPTRIPPTESPSKSRSFVDLDGMVAPAPQVEAFEGVMALREGIEEDGRPENDVFNPDVTKNNTHRISQGGLPSPPTSTDADAEDTTTPTQVVSSLPTRRTTRGTQKLAPPPEIQEAMQTPKRSTRQLRSSSRELPPARVTRATSATQDGQRSVVEIPAANKTPVPPSPRGRRSKATSSQVDEIESSQIRLPSPVAEEMEEGTPVKANGRPTRAAVRKASQQTRHSGSEGGEDSLPSQPITRGRRASSRIASSAQVDQLASSQPRHPSPIPETPPPSSYVHFNPTSPILPPSSPPITETQTLPSSRVLGRRLTDESPLFGTQPTQMAATQVYNLHPSSLVPDSESQHQEEDQDQEGEAEEASGSGSSSESENGTELFSQPVKPNGVYPSLSFSKIPPSASQPAPSSFFPTLSSLPKDILRRGYSAFSGLASSSSQPTPKKSVLADNDSESSSDDTDSDHENISANLKGRYAGAKPAKQKTGGLMKKGW
ncbi:hypothetical protein P7C73_g379, partial [Tremellales sp. Uapishka_1]